MSTLLFDMNHTCKFFTVLTAAALLLCSCDRTDRLDELSAAPNPQETADSVFTYPLTFDVPYPEQETRATDAGVWEDGDVVYLRLTGSKDIYATAQYQKSGGTWQLTTSAPLTSATGASCSLWYGKGANLVHQAYGVACDYLTAAYQTSEGRYSFKNGLVTLSATLRPYGRRLRFKGESGQSVEVQLNADLYGLDGFNTSQASAFSRKERTVSLTVRSNGYTDYLVFGVTSANSQLTLNYLGLNYCRSFTAETLSSGESGYLSLPSSSNLRGWQIAHEAVDLGLSVKWATCNVGANTPEEYGLYFAWGETVGYGQDTSDGRLFDWGKYKWCKGSQTTMTKYCTKSQYGTVDNKTTLELTDDAARANWGGTWRMPTMAELDELCYDCTWTWTTSQSVNGYRVTGKNGNFIFLPAAGYRSNGRLNDAGSSGYYWSSSLNSSGSYSAYYLYFYSGSRSTNGSSRFYGRSVRPVCQ